MPSSSDVEPRRFWTAQQSADEKATRHVAYVTMQDAEARAEIVSVLERAGWAVIPQPTGFHLLQSIADVVEGRYTWLDPMLIVIDAYARGCAGTTIAAGLRDLGIEIPIVLITTPGQRVPVTTDAALRVITSSDAPAVVQELARGHLDALDSPDLAHRPLAERLEPGERARFVVDYRGAGTVGRPA